MGARIVLDYLVIGHVTQDVVDGGFTVGGTVSYASRTARALNCRVGIVTSASPDLDLSQELDGALVARFPAPMTTTFSNIYSSAGRHQVLHGIAAPLVPEMIPENWQAALVHIGPLVSECSLELLNAFDDAFVGVTPQGWMRHWDEEGHVSPCEWEDPEPWLARADAVVLSSNDVASDELMAQYVAQSRLLVVTRGAAGCSVHMAGQVRDFPAPIVQEVDPTGAGDIFAAAFFVWMQRRGDPWAAARFANCVAARSVTRVGLAGTPWPEDVAQCKRRMS
jgi:sugar/nucleoside kinase (ribokinase family)